MKMKINQTVLESNWSDIKRKLRGRWGQLNNDDLESAQDNVNRLVTEIQRKTGEASETIEQYLAELTSDRSSAGGETTEKMREFAHSAQDKAQDVAKRTSDALKSGYSKTESTIQQRPMESVAACFGIGLLAGALVGLMFQQR
jgi:ElaB/YqjD/DUF883 family membrane-anchored ribosome-binding protein